MGSSPSRPGTFAQGGDVNVAPGQYDHGGKFGDNVKSFRIGERRPDRPDQGVGPGAYEPERADAQTRQKSPNINLGSSPSRPGTFAQGGDVNVAPGQYDHGGKFGSDAKSFRIGEKREERRVETMGPGAYSPERADGMTKSKIPNINLGSSPSRPGTFAKGGDVNVAPGQYDHGGKFGDNAKSFRIGEKRPERPSEGVGPGAYEPELADALTKSKSPNINLGSSPGRPV